MKLFNKRNFSTLISHFSFQKGFTLIELLIVIAILGILAAGILVAINPLGQFQKARNSQRKSDLRNMQQAVESYAIHNNGVYPTTNAAWCGAVSSYWNTCGDDFIPGVVAAGDIKVLPKDPSTGKGMPLCSNDPRTTTYRYLSDGTNYKIQAYCTPEGNVLNDPTDPFYDQKTPAWAWQVSSPGAINW